MRKKEIRKSGHRDAGYQVIRKSGFLKPSFLNPVILITTS